MVYPAAQPFHKKLNSPTGDIATGDGLPTQAMRKIALSLTAIACLWAIIVTGASIQMEGGHLATGWHFRELLLSVLSGLLLALATSAPWLSFAWLCAWAAARRKWPFPFWVQFLICCVHVVMPFGTFVLFFLLTFTHH